MISTQDSIDNCTICQNSRQKNYCVAPNNYERIFGYIGPASRTNVKLSNTAKKHYSKQSRHNIAKFNRVFYSKMKYDNSEADFENRKPSKKKATNSKVKHKHLDSKSKSRKKELHYDGSNSNLTCSSFDSYAWGRKKKFTRKIDSEDKESKIAGHRNKVTVKSREKKKHTIDKSNWSFDSSEQLKRGTGCGKPSNCSMKFRKLRAVLADLFGSADSLRISKRHKMFSVDSEDRDPKMLAFTKNTKPNKDECTNLRKHSKKIHRKSSKSSTDISDRGNLLNRFLISVDSMKNIKKARKARTRPDEEDLAKKKPCVARDKTPKPKINEVNKKSKVPATTKSKLPVTTKSKEPATTKSKYTATSKIKVSAISKTKVPAVSKTKVPATSRTKVPATSKTKVPATSKHKLFKDFFSKKQKN